MNLRHVTVSEYLVVTMSLNVDDDSASYASLELLFFPTFGPPTLYWIRNMEYGCMGKPVFNLKFNFEHFKPDFKGLFLVK